MLIEKEMSAFEKIHVGSIVFVCMNRTLNKQSMSKIFRLTTSAVCT